MAKIKRLIWDIETSPNIGLFWRAGFKINISHDSIIQERKIITIAAKWHGESKVKAWHWDGKQDDKAMLKAFVPILNEADESVAHFGDSFDLPWFKTRCLIHGIQTFPSYKTIDTLQWARRHFYFNSNKLDYLAQLLGIGAKLHTEYDLWKKILLDKDAKALSYMVTYNKEDVVLLEKVYERLAEVVPHKTHVGVMNGGEKWSCPKDGSENVIISKTRVTALGTKQYQFRCKDCGAYYTVSEPAKRAYIKHIEAPKEA